MSVPCKHCESKDHTSFYCYRKPRKAIQVRKPLIANPLSKRQRLKAIKKQGKVATKWRLVKEDWYVQYGMYHPCHYCGIGLKPETITLDHLVARSRAPELRYVLSNLVPSCFFCNGRKGSIDHDDYPHTCHS